MDCNLFESVLAWALLWFWEGLGPLSLQGFPLYVNVFWVTIYQFKFNFEKNNVKALISTIWGGYMTPNQSVWKIVASKEYSVELISNTNQPLRKSIDEHQFFPFFPEQCVFHWWDNNLDLITAGCCNYCCFGEEVWGRHNSCRYLPFTLFFFW